MSPIYLLFKGEGKRGVAMTQSEAREKTEPLSIPKSPNWEIRENNFRLSGNMKNTRMTGCGLEKSIDVCTRSHEMALISEDFLVSSNSGNDNPHFTPYISRPVVHRNTKRPLVSSLQLFISQPRIGWVCSQSFELLPELNSDFFG